MSVPKPIFITVLFLTSLLVTTLVGQSESDKQSDNHDEFEYPTAQQVIDKYVQAMGGYEVLESRRSIHGIYNGYSSRGSTYQYENYQVEGKFSSRFNFDDGRILERGVLTDGTRKEDGSRNGWVWESTDGVMRQLRPDETQDYLRRRASISSITKMFDFYKSIEFGSSETIDDREVYRLLFTDKGGKEFERFFDVETGLLRRQICVESLANKNYTVVRDYTDYQSMGDFMVAQKQVATHDDGLSWTYEVELYEVDQRVPRTTFDIPKEVAVKIAKAKAEEQKKKAIAKTKPNDQPKEATETSSDTVQVGK